MAIIRGGTTGAMMEVESTSLAGRVTNYPHEVVGAYVGRWTTGVIAAALAVDAPVACIRNGAGGGNTKNVYICQITLGWQWVTAPGASQQFGFYLERFNTANMGGGQTYSEIDMASTQPNSACRPGGAEGGDIRASTNAALTVVGVVFDGAQPEILSWTSAAIGTGADRVVTLSESQGKAILLSSGEGLCLRNSIVWPAAGTGVVTGWIKWEELGA